MFHNADYVRMIGPEEELGLPAQVMVGVGEVGVGHLERDGSACGAMVRPEHQA